MKSLASFSISIVLMFLMACKTSSTPKVLQSPTVPLVFMLSDASFSKGLGADYYYNGSECFVVVYDLGYAAPVEWYHIHEISASVFSDIVYVINSKGTLPAQEGGFRKYAYVKGFSTKLSEHFDQEVPDVALRFQRLRSSLILKKYQTSILPEWISQANNINKKFGLKKE